MSEHASNSEGRNSAVPFDSDSCMSELADLENLSRDELLQRCRELASELARANTRTNSLAELLNISASLSLELELPHQEVADELEHALLADAALFYVYSGRGYVPIGISGGFKQLTPLYCQALASTGFVSLIARNRHTMTMNRTSAAVAPDGSSVVKDAKGMRYKIKSPMAACCQTILGTPVFADDRCGAVILCGWVHEHQVSSDEIALMEIIAKAFTVSLASAFNTFRMQRSHDLMEAGRAVHALMDQYHGMNLELAFKIALVVQQALIAHTMIIQEDGKGHCFVWPMPDDDRQFLAADFSLDECFDRGEVVKALTPASNLGQWIKTHTELTGGFIVALNPAHAKPGSRIALLVLRPDSEIPFDFVDEGFLHEVNNEIDHIISVEKAHASDAQIAHALQVGLRNEIPQVPGITTASLYLSATEAAVVGGDFFDLRQLGRTSFVAVMGDVSGKGVEAAVAASLAKTGLAAYAWQGSDPADMVSSLNNLFVNFSRLETFATMCVVHIDTAHGRATYCSAGNPAAMLVHNPDSASPELELLTVQSPVVGAFEGLHYISGSFTFAVGDLLFLYTDGTTEARNQQGAFFGEANLRQALLRACRYNLDDIPRRILKEVEQFCAQDIHDDIAMLVIRFDEAPLSA